MLLHSSGHLFLSGGRASSCLTVRLACPSRQNLDPPLTYLSVVIHVHRGPSLVICSNGRTANLVLPMSSMNQPHDMLAAMNENWSDSATVDYVGSDLLLFFPWTPRWISTLCPFHCSPVSRRGLRFSWERVFVMDLELRTLPHGLIGVYIPLLWFPRFPPISCMSTFSRGPRLERLIQPLMQPEPEPTRSVAAKSLPDMGASARQRSVTNVRNCRTGINTVGDVSINWTVLGKSAVPPGRFKGTGTGPIRTTQTPTSCWRCLQ